MKTTIDVTQTARVSDVLGREFPWLGKGKIKRLIDGKNISVGGKRTAEDVVVPAGERCEVFLPEAFAPPEIPVVYADDNVVIADKPVKIDSVAALPACLRGTYGTLYPVHRLDTNTTGLVVLARGRKTETELVRAFRDRAVRKKYVATVVGTPKPAKGRLVGYLVKDASRGLVTVSDKPVRGGSEAVTEYEVLRSYDGLSDVALYPLTGRTHQLRAQLAHIGCPVLGDGKYGDFEENKKRGVALQRLRAVSVKFLSLSGIVDYLSGREFEVRE